jgi:hypothetical protein
MQQTSRWAFARDVGRDTSDASGGVTLAGGGVWSQPALFKPALRLPWLWTMADAERGTTTTPNVQLLQSLRLAAREGVRARERVDARRWKSPTRTDAECARTRVHTAPQSSR